MQASRPPQHARIAAVVPSIVGWRSFRHVWLNLLVFGVAVLAGTWVVHQTEYTIEYGRRFSTVMATSPHRFYMASAGFALSVALGAFLVLCGTFLTLSRLRLGRLLQQLPPRLSRHVHPGRSMVPVHALLLTALVLVLAQFSVYLLQENLEYLASVGTLPGFAVLLAPQHATVIPLHLVVAGCSSLLLWSISAWLGYSRRAVGVARVLLDMVSRGAAAPPRHFPSHAYVPSLRVAAGVFCLRSPPLIA
jgi:hypothetical protein